MTGRNRDDTNKSTLMALIRDLKGADRRLILRAKNTGACMIIRGTTLSGTLLYTTEFLDFLCARYNVYPLNPQSHCNGYGTNFGVTHGLSCSIGGLVIARHNKICDKLLYLARLNFTPSSVCAEHLIHQGCTKS